MTHTDQPRPGIFDLARQLVGGVVRLVKLEVTHGRQEIGAREGGVRVGDGSRPRRVERCHLSTVTPSGDKRRTRMPRM